MNTIDTNICEESLFYTESVCLNDFRQKIESNQVSEGDIIQFSDKFSQLISEVQAITQITDDLQKSLDRANNQIEEKREEIAIQNGELENTINELAQAKVSQRSSVILLITAFVIFLLEELFIQDMVYTYMSGWFDSGSQSIIGSMVILGVVFLFIKFFEGKTERYFLNLERRKILKPKT